MEIKELEDIDFDEVVKNHEENDLEEVVFDVPEVIINLDEVMDFDVIYSYPYYTNTEHDYQFRITMKEDSYELEEIKADESDISDKNLKILKTYGEQPLDHLLTSIDESIDIRNGNQLPKDQSDLVNYDLDTSDSVQLKKDIERNKKLVLRELYEQIIEANS